jgi:hypothetical protein
MTLTIFIWLFKSISSVPIGFYVVFLRAGKRDCGLGTRSMSRVNAPSEADGGGFPAVGSDRFGGNGHFSV